MNHIARVRPRFRLRTLLVATAAIAVALTIVVRAQRESIAVADWDQGLRNFICERLGRTPVGTRTIDALNSPSDPGSTLSADAARLPRLGMDQLASLTYWTPSVTLDAHDALRSETPAQLAERLLCYYESGLEAHGMVRKTIQLCSVGPQSTEPSAVWLSADPRLGGVVTIDVRVDERTRTATIQLRHIARPDIGLW